MRGSLRADPPAARRHGGRVALVIGNGRYGAGLEFENTYNDAQDVGRSLDALGFDVEYRFDASQEEIHTALRIHSDRSAGAAVSVVYFAGLGEDVDGTSYWLGSLDVSLGGLEEWRKSRISLFQILQDVAKADLGIVIHDAPRSDLQGVPRLFGYNALDQVRGMALGNLLLLYSVLPGRMPLLDTNNRNSFFADALVTVLSGPAAATADVRALYASVKELVQSATNGEQVPISDWVLDDPDAVYSLGVRRE